MAAAVRLFVLRTVRGSPGPAVGLRGARLPVWNLPRFRHSASSSQGHDAAASEEKSTHFGFETVPEGQKAERVYKVFESVAQKYDVMNDAMSMGIHRLWKDALLHTMNPLPGTRLLDVAGGTEKSRLFIPLRLLTCGVPSLPPDIIGTAA
ncbi:2-methoxy-6-polyprenyl-1,4-benzoquinol methylase, mitochondrial [Arapaima gigas]